MLNKSTFWALALVLSISGAQAQYNAGSLIIRAKSKAVSAAEHEAANAKYAIKKEIKEKKAEKEQKKAENAQKTNNRQSQGVRAAFNPDAIDAPVLYVSNTGNNGNEGSEGAPLKNLQKAIDKAAAGTVIKVAEGNYYGLLNSGTIQVTKPVYIFGGYSKDFSERDVLRHRTMIQPTPTSNGTMKQATVILAIDNANAELLFDGIIFDRGNTISYCSSKEPERKAQPEGVESPRMNPIGTAGIGGANLSEKTFTSESSIFYLNNSRCIITLHNCAFINAPDYAILGLFKGTLNVDNCIFVNQRMAAVDVRGSDAKVNSNVNFTNNTVLFTWSRTADFGDMGYGYRFQPGTNCNLRNNIFGCSIFAGIDYTHIDGDKAREATRNVQVNNNIFFLNRKGDLTIPGGGNFMYINSSDFSDVEYLDAASGNKTISDPSVFKGKIDEAYLKGFINANYTETTNYDPNSEVNTFRQAFGMNQVGTITSKTTMYANRYRWEKALLLFGAVDGCGAQSIK